MRLRYWLAALALAGLMAPDVQAAEKSSKVASFNALQAPSVETVRAQAAKWLKDAGKTDAATQKAFDEIWSTDRPLLEQLADTFMLGNAEAAKLLGDARDPSVPTPKAMPEIFANSKDEFFRSNLGLAFAKALSNRRDYEVALETLKTIKPEKVIDPATYFFHKAVAEHGTLQKTEASRSINRLLDDVADAPDRYKMVSMLMILDMAQWREKDLAEIARKMDNIERRLELARGGPQTQRMQKDVLARLDELIKQLEQQQKNQQGQGNPNGGGCPNGGGGQQPGNQPGSGTPTSPQQDSIGGQNSGPGKVDEKTLKQLADLWGKLPERERAAAMAEMSRSMPARYREIIESYFKKTSEAQK
jgi:hypothetical protein